MLCTLQKLQNLLSVTSLQLMSVASALPVTLDAGTTVALVLLSDNSLSNSSSNSVIVEGRFDVSMDALLRLDTLLADLTHAVEVSGDILGLVIWLERAIRNVAGLNNPNLFDLLRPLRVILQSLPEPRNYQHQSVLPPLRTYRGI